MSERLNSIDLQNFLRDFKENSQTEVYEDGKEKDEIIRIAKVKGIDLQDNTDLAGFKTIYTFADIANGNGARLPEHLLLKALPSLIGKPININHVRNYVVGYYIDYRYIESEKKVIAYGIFFKSNFGQEWAEAKQLLKSSLLGTSHEVWCPRKSRRYLSDGTYEAQAIEFAGGALIYRTHPDSSNPGKNIDTAYKGCDVLEMAIKFMNQNQEDLITASIQMPARKKYQDEDLVTANESVVPNSIGTNQPKPPDPLPQVPQITCGFCNHRFETIAVGEIPCPECRAIIDRSGKVLYPPQKINFSFRDPLDGSSNWRLIEDTDHRAVVKNINSGRIYELSYKTKDNNDDLMNRLKFVYIGSSYCPQCGHGASFSTVSNLDQHEIECKQCGLKYFSNIKKDSLRKQIHAYRDITDSYKNISSEGENQNVLNETKELTVASLNETAALEDIELETANLQNEIKLDETKMPVEPPALDLLTASEEPVLSNDSNENLLSAKLKKYRTAIKKMASKIREMRKYSNLETSKLNSANQLEIAKIHNEADKKINWYKTHAVELIKRREFLSKFGDHLSDEKILDDDSYARVKLEKENALLKASKESGNDVVADKCILGRDDAELNRLKNEIDHKAFKIS